MCLCFKIGLLLCVWKIASASPRRVEARVNIEEEKPTGQPIAELSRIIAGGTQRRKSPRYKLLTQKLKVSSSTFATSAGRAGKWLRIDSGTGTLTFARQFDRDAECTNSAECTIVTQVVVTPEKMLQIVQLEIAIDDVNDNAPTFPVSVHRLNISESASAGDVINLDAFQAKDIDFDRNSYLRYSLSPNPYFRLNSFVDEKNSSHLRLHVTQSPDYEKLPELDLDVWARDAGAPSLSGEMKLKINIINANDNAPVFEKDLYMETLEENTPAGTTVATVKATDADGGLFGLVRYAISSRNSLAVQRLAQIDERRGTIWIKQPLDREKHHDLRILIEARDSDSQNPKVGETLLVIKVEDVNDNTPSITVDFISQSNGDTVYLSESTANGSYIAKVSARDADYGKNGKTEITVKSTPLIKEQGKTEREHEKQQFSLASDGFLATDQEFDREICSRYNMLIEACDHGLPPRCARKQISVVVLDENEYAPKVESPLVRVSLSEDVYEGTEVATIRAEDGDAANGYALTRNQTGHILKSRNGEIAYSITKGNYGVFSIDKRGGVMRVMSRLDREKRAEWKLTVSVRDGGYPPLESFCTVLVTVEDENDNAPVFVSPAVNNTLIYADISSNKVITKIQARDFDAGDNGKVFYFIANSAAPSEKAFGHRKSAPRNGTNVDSYFILNPISGDLRLNFSKNMSEGAVGIHTISIRAKDSGPVPLSTETTLRLAVGDYRTGHVQIFEPAAGGSSLDFLMLAISLGCATAILIFVIACVVIRSKKLNREIDGLGKTATMRPVIRQRAHSVEGVVVDGVNNVHTPATNGYTSTPGGKEDMVGDVMKSAAIQTGTGAPTQHQLHGVVNDSEVQMANDNDSGRGESDVEAASLLVNDSKKRYQRKDLGVNCTGDCRVYGHSDECWMPAEGEPTPTPPPPHTSDAAKPSSSMFYDWDKLRPRYGSPERALSRKGSRCSYASTSNTDHAQSVATSQRSVNGVSMEEDRPQYKPRHHSASHASDALRYNVHYQARTPLPYTALPYADPTNSQRNIFQACYRYNNCAPLTGDELNVRPISRSQTPSVRALGSRQATDISFSRSRSNIPHSSSSHCDLLNQTSDVQVESEVSILEPCERLLSSAV